MHENSLPSSGSESESVRPIADAHSPLDAQTGPRLSAFMAQGWSAAGHRPAPAADEVAPLARARRDRLSERFPTDVLVVPTGTSRVRSNDTFYRFRAGSDYAWLVGDLEPDGVLVMWPESDGHRSVVYVPARADRTGTAFFTDRRYGELWVGPRRGPEEVAASLGVDSAPLTPLPAALAARAPGPIRVVRGLDASVDACVPVSAAAGTPVASAALDRDALLRQTLDELRVLKDDWEVGQLEQAVAATVTGFEECVRELPVAMREERGERWLEGTFFRRSRLSGNDVGYGSVVACGNHATTLHWTRDDGPVCEGELLLLDMGVEGDRLYTADVTRTLPVSGSFSPVQRRVYDLVWRAQQAGLAAVVPGGQFADIYLAAMTIISEALVEWGLLDGPVEQVVIENLHRRWTLARISHHLGLDVHDCNQARQEISRQVLTPGMVITVEPGLYFQRDDDLVPAELRGIGVRLEDDVLVTENGSRVLSAGLPSEASAVEDWMRHLLSGGARQAPAVQSSAGLVRRA